MSDAVFCLTCCFAYDDELSEDDNEDAHLAHDGAHYPVWSNDPSEELDITVSLADTGKLPPYLR